MDTDNLERFLVAQESSFDTALREIRQGKKRTHWMWYVFPQVAGLGFSQTSKVYAIRDGAEAKRYLDHPVLRERLVTISRALLEQTTNSANQVLGNPDDVKLQSCMTLFAAVPGTDPVFQQVLDKYFSGMPDQKTLDILADNK